MAVLKEIFMVMFYIFGIIALFLLTLSLIATFIRERRADKAVNEFADILLTELEKALEEKEKKPRKTTKTTKTTKKTTKKEEN